VNTAKCSAEKRGRKVGDGSRKLVGKEALRYAVPEGSGGVNFVVLKSEKRGWGKAGRSWNRCTAGNGDVVEKQAGEDLT